jgi:hypothetical protein
MRRAWRAAPLVALAVAGGGPLAQEAEAPATILVRPGQDIQALVEAAPEAARFRLAPGIHRQPTIRPKSRQEFLGEEGVILSGARLLDSWTPEAGFWASEPLPDALPAHGSCADGSDSCSHREDLFVDGRLYRRAGSLADLGPGRWHRTNGRAYLFDDPSGRTVEIGTVPAAFDGTASGVVLEKLVVERYASDPEEGAIHAKEASGWLIVDVTARWNHGVGLKIGSGTRVIGGSFSYNGQLGIAATGDGATIDGVEIAYNNYAGYDARWEAGGAKLWMTQGLVVRNACVHHNGGPGLWTDHDSIAVVYQGNRIFANAQEGIRHGLSYAAIIEDNMVGRNGRSGDNWMSGAQILIQNSGDTKVRRNLVEVAATFGNGIGIIHQDRGAGGYGPWAATGNLVSGNTIIHLGRRGRDGVVSDTGDPTFWDTAGNVFDANTYIVVDAQVEHWTARDRAESWEQIGKLGLEPNGRVIVEQRAPSAWSCAG